ncbi:MAG: hypothetical protein WDN27_04865 [Candidatus Saccharibacteria bacterium]
MTGPATFEPLAARIDGLDPNQTAGELASLVEGRCDSALQEVIAVGDAGSSAQVLDSVGMAIERIDDPASRSELGKKVSEVIIDGLRAQDDHDVYDALYDEARVLSDRVTGFIEQIEDPKDRAFQFLYASGQMAGRIPNHQQDGPVADRKEVLTVAISANDLMSKARENALLIADPSSRIHALAALAEGAAENFAHARAFIPTLEGYRDDRRIRRALVNFPETMYGDARQVVLTESGKPEDQASARGTIAVSMVRSAGIVNDMSWGTAPAGRLTVKAVEHLDVARDGYRDSRLALSEKVIALSKLGASVSTAVAENYQEEDVHPNDTSESNGQKLIEATARIFSDAREHAQAITARRKGGIRALISSAPDEHLSNVSSHYAAVAAVRFLETNPDEAKGLFRDAFAIGEVEDALRGSRSDSADAVTALIREQAKKQDDLKRGFGLFSLANQLEEGRLAAASGVTSDADGSLWVEGRTSHQLQVNARNALDFLALVRPEEEVAIEEIDRGLVERMIRAATVDTHYATVPYLGTIGRHVKDPSLRLAIEEQAEALRAKAESDSLPKTETENIARQLVAAQVEHRQAGSDDPAPAS